MHENDRDDASDKETREKEATHILAEARMVLPGVQALFGFQLMAVYNQPFTTLLSAREQILHLGGLVLAAVTVALLMTPAAYHRQSEPHQISCTFLRLSSGLLTLGMFTLMLSIQIDCYLVARIVLKDKLASGIMAVLLGLAYLSLWYLLPRAMRKKRMAPQPGSILIALK